MATARKRRRRRGPAPVLLLALGAWLLWRGSPAPAPQPASWAEELPVRQYEPGEEEETPDQPQEGPQTQAAADVSEAALPQGGAPPAANIAAISIDGSSGGYDGAGSIYIKNETDYTIDIPALLKQKTEIAISSKETAVLIVHTHGSEAYTPDAANWYEPTDTDRTTDTNYNVVRVGAEIEKILNEKGIKTVHATVLNDSPSYNGAYNRTLDVISQAMKENPSIKFVIDVHRDAMVTASGKKYKTVAQINGRQAAQLMLVAGTDAGGLTHDHWRENLAFMTKVQNKMNAAYPGIMRPINIRAARFNEHVTTGSMLLEVGTSGNSLDEALYSASLFADTLGDMLLELQK